MVVAVPIKYGDTIVDTQGRSGVAKFDSKTGAPLAPTPTAIPTPNTTVPTVAPTTNSGGSTQTAPTAPPANSNGQSYPYTPPGSVNASAPFSVATNNITPSPAPTSDEQFFQQIYQHLQPGIDAANAAEVAAEKAANIKSTQQTSANNFSLNARGMAGSSEADSEAIQNENDRGNAIAQAKSVQAAAVAQITETASSEAQTEFQQALTRSDNLSTAYIAQKKTDAQQSVKSLALTGMSLDSLQSQNPNEYNSLLQYYGGDPNVMKADWISAAQPISLDGGKPIQSGTHLIYTFKDPITGKTFTQDIDTGVPLDANWTTARDAAGGLFQINKATGETKQLTSDDPTYQANKQATLDTKVQRLENSKALEASKIIGSQINNDAAITNFEAISPIMGRIQSATNEINSGNINESNAGALLDDITKLNTQGQAITSGQVDLTKSSLSFQDQAKVLAQKVAGSGGVIDPKVAADILKLANDNYALYNKAYQDHIKIYNNRLSNVNGQDLTQYSPLTDITNLPSVKDGSYDAALNAANNANVDTSSITDSTSLIDNGDGTYTDPSTGDVIAPTQ